VHNGRGKYDMVKLLIKNGANPNSLNNEEISPLMFAETIGDKKMIEILR